MDLPYSLLYLCHSKCQSEDAPETFLAFPPAHIRYLPYNQAVFLPVPCLLFAAPEHTSSDGHNRNIIRTSSGSPPGTRQAPASQSAPRCRPTRTGSGFFAVFPVSALYQFLRGFCCPHSFDLLHNRHQSPRTPFVLLHSGPGNILPPPAEGQAAFLRSASAAPAIPATPVTSPTASLQYIRHTK